MNDKPFNLTCIHVCAQGIVSEEKVDTFNIPVYNMCPQELKEAVEGNGSFSIDIMEDLPVMRTNHVVSGGRSKSVAQVIIWQLRATSEGLLKNHFKVKSPILVKTFCEHEHGP